jgi:hypothetical protein
MYIGFLIFSQPELGAGKNWWKVEVEGRRINRPYTSIFHLLQTNCQKELIGGEKTSNKTDGYFLLVTIHYLRVTGYFLPAFLNEMSRFLSSPANRSSDFKNIYIFIRHLKPMLSFR